MSRRQLCIGVAIYFICYLHAVAAATDTPDSTLSPWLTIGRLTGALCLVLLVFWISVRLVGKAQGLTRHPNSSLKLLETVSVGQRERVIVIQAGKEQLVLGVTASQVNLLVRLDEPITSGTHDTSSDFKTKLARALGSKSYLNDESKAAQRPQVGVGEGTGT